MFGFGKKTKKTALIGNKSLAQAKGLLLKSMSLVRAIPEVKKIDKWLAEKEKDLGLVKRSNGTSTILLAVVMLLVALFVTSLLYTLLSIILNRLFRRRQPSTRAASAPRTEAITLANGSQVTRKEIQDAEEALKQSIRDLEQEKKASEQRLNDLRAQLTSVTSKTPTSIIDKMAIKSQTKQVQVMLDAEMTGMKSIESSINEVNVALASQRQAMQQFL